MGVGTICTTKCGTSKYVPQVPHLRYTCGTKTRTPQDGDKFTDFWIDLMKIGVPPFFRLGLVLERPFWTARFGPPVLDRLFWTTHLLVQFSPGSSVPRGTS